MQAMVYPMAGQSKVPWCSIWERIFTIGITAVRSRCSLCRTALGARKPRCPPLFLLMQIQGGIAGHVYTKHVHDVSRLYMRVMRDTIAEDMAPRRKRLIPRLALTTGP